MVVDFVVAVVAAVIGCAIGAGWTTGKFEEQARTLEVCVARLQDQVSALQRCHACSEKPPRKKRRPDLEVVTTAGYTPEEQAEYCANYCPDEHHSACALRTVEVKPRG